MKRRIAAASALLLVGSWTVQAHDALLTQAISRAALPASELHGSIRSTTTVTGGAKPEVDTDTVDVSKSPNQALASYADLKDVIGADAHVVRREAGRTVYAFTTHCLPEGASGTGDVKLGIDKHDTAQTFDGEAEVRMDADGHPFVSHLQLHLPKAMGNVFMARIKRIDLSYAFAPVTAKAAMVATAATADVDVRALLFVHRQAHADATLVMADTP